MKQCEVFMATRTDPPTPFYPDAAVFGNYGVKCRNKAEWSVVQPNVQVYRVCGRHRDLTWSEGAVIEPFVDNELS